MLISDLEKDDIKLFNFKNTDIVSKSCDIKKCVGCFTCWKNGLGKCILSDEYQNMGERLSKVNKLIIISKCKYGCYSSFVKNVLDRSIGYVSPYFRILNGEMHHEKRYDKKLDIDVYFYGNDITEKEKKVAKRLVKANAVNFDSNIPSVKFYNNINELMEAFNGNFN